LPSNNNKRLVYARCNACPAAGATYLSASAFLARFRITHSSTCGQSHLRYTWDEHWPYNFEETKEVGED
jgi:hypothetical protein